MHSTDGRAIPAEKRSAQMSQLFADQEPATTAPGLELLDTLNGSAAVAVTYSADGGRAIVSAWTGGSTVNTIGIRLTPGGIAVTGFDVWTSYELDGLTVAEVVDKMDEAARIEPGLDLLDTDGGR
jgi:hypothetical protein